MNKTIWEEPLYPATARALILGTGCLSISNPVPRLGREMI